MKTPSGNTSSPAEKNSGSRLPACFSIVRHLMVMDEATAALDPVSQDQLMRLVLERLPDATIVSVGHRAELEAFHTRKLVLEYHPEGARLVGEEALPRTFGRSTRFLARLRPRARASQGPHAARGAG